MTTLACAVPLRTRRTGILHRMTEGKFLDMAGVAEKTGLAYATVRFYHNKAEARRREIAAEAEREGSEQPQNTSQPGVFPPPDDVFGRSPVWRESTIDTWMANRPGRGAGGGRPRKHPKE